MLRSLYSGVSGMRSFQTKMDVIANNVANVNTTGFKSGRAKFQDMLSQTTANAQAPMGDTTQAFHLGGINAQQVGLGVRVGAIDTIMTGGALQPTNRSLDFAVEGEGFFIVKPTSANQAFYTRDGGFYTDYEGNIINANGNRVLGYQVNTAFPSGEDDDSYPDTIEEENWTSARDPKVVGLEEKIDGESLGEDEAPQNLDINQLRALKIYENLALAKKDVNPDEDATDDNGNLLDNKVGGVGKFNIYKKANAADDDATYDLVSDEELENYKLQDFTIDGTGIITGIYSDGADVHTIYLGKIALGTFNNPEGLEKAGNNNYVQSNNSGQVVVEQAGKGNAGNVRQGFLEMSNVDLANEFTEMIVASRAYQANSRSITTSDEMLMELINLKR